MSAVTYLVIALALFASECYAVKEKPPANKGKRCFDCILKPIASLIPPILLPTVSPPCGQAPRPPPVVQPYPTVQPVATPPKEPGLEITAHFPRPKPFPPFPIFPTRHPTNVPSFPAVISPVGERPSVNHPNVIPPHVESPGVEVPGFRPQQPSRTPCGVVPPPDSPCAQATAKPNAEHGQCPNNDNGVHGNYMCFSNKDCFNGWVCCPIKKDWNHRLAYYCMPPAK